MRVVASFKSARSPNTEGRDILGEDLFEGVSSGRIWERSSEMKLNRNWEAYLSSLKYVFKGVFLQGKVSSPHKLSIET